MEEILKWLTCWTSSFFIQTVTKIPTICLLATRLYFIWLLVIEVDMPVSMLVLCPSSSSSEESSSRLTNDCWHRKHNSLLNFLSSSSCGEEQLHVLSLLLLSVLKDLLTFFREGFWKKSEPPGEKVAGFVNPREFRLHDWFSDWLIKDSHLAAGSLSSMTSTFPAFSGTIS